MYEDEDQRPSGSESLYNNNNLTQSDEQKLDKISQTNDNLEEQIKNNPANTILLKQYILGSISFLNTSAMIKNKFKLMFTKNNSTEQQRENNIRQALQDILNMPNLSKYGIYTAAPSLSLGVIDKVTNNKFNLSAQIQPEKVKYYNNKQLHPEKGYFSRITSFNPFTKKNGGGKKYKTRKYKKTHKIYKHYK
jgi:hypothetical protein